MYFTILTLLVISIGTSFTTALAIASTKTSTAASASTRASDHCGRAKYINQAYTNSGCALKDSKIPYNQQCVCYSQIIRNASMALSTACKTAVERGKEQDAFNSTSEYLDFVPSVIAGNGEEETKEYDAMS